MDYINNCFYDAQGTYQCYKKCNIKEEKTIERDNTQCLNKSILNNKKSKYVNFPVFPTNSDLIGISTRNNENDFHKVN